MSESGFIFQSESVWPAETVKMKINDQKKKSVRDHTQHPIFARLAFQSPGKNRDKQLTFIVRVSHSLLVMDNRNISSFDRYI
jgi:hypothetical protein